MFLAAKGFVNPEQLNWPNASHVAACARFQCLHKLLWSLHSSKVGDNHLTMTGLPWLLAWFADLTSPSCSRNVNIFSERARETNHGSVRWQSCKGKNSWNGIFPLLISGINLSNSFLRESITKTYYVAFFICTISQPFRAHLCQQATCGEKKHLWSSGICRICRLLFRQRWKSMRILASKVIL